MKNLVFSLFFCISFCLFSCSNDENNDSKADQNLMTLKRVEFVSESSNGHYSKRIRYYLDNQVIADTLFDEHNDWQTRYVTLTVGSTKKSIAYNVDGSSQTLQNEDYDTEGKITGRYTAPETNAISFTYVYNSDNTTTSVLHNNITGQTSDYKKYYKNINGLIYKELDIATNQESSISFTAEIPYSITKNNTTTIFNYFQNPMPSNLLKTTTQINNSILVENELQKIATSGNYYYKQTNTPFTTYATIFNELNYKTLEKSIITNQNSSNITTTYTVSYIYN